MAITQTVAFEVLAQVEKYHQGLAKMEGITAEAAAKAALKLEKELTKGQVNAAKSAEKAAAKSAKAFEDAAEKSGKAAENVGRGLEKGFKTLGGPIGAAADTLFDLGETMGLLASPTGIAVAAVVAASLAFTGLVVAVGSGVVALGKATLAADEALESLAGFEAIGSDFFPMVPVETQESIDNVNASFDALTSIGDKLTVVVGSNVAGSFETVANAAVGLALTAAETFEEFSKGKNLLHEFAVFMGSGFLNALLAPLVPMGGLAAGFLALSSAAGVDLPDAAEESLRQLSRLSTDLAGLSHDLSEGVVTYGENTVAATGLGEALEGVSAKGAAFISTQQRATKASEDAKGALAAQKKEAAELAKEQAKAADEAAKWAHELDLLRNGADLTELSDKVDDIAAALKAGSITADEAAELQIAAFDRYEEAVSEAEQKVRDELAKTAKAEKDALDAAERDRREGLSDFERSVEDVAAALQKAGWGEAAAKQIATVDVALNKGAAASEAYVEAIGNIASMSFDKHSEAFGALTDQIEGLDEQIGAIDELIAGLSDSTVDAATLSGEALVEAYKDGQVAAEDLSEAQKTAIAGELIAETAALEAQKEIAEQKAAMEKEAAITAFGIQKASDIASTVTAGLVGAVAAFKLGPIAGAIAAGGIAALTATNVGLIAATKPQFHAGGIGQGMYPDEANSKTLAGEGWLNRQAVNNVGGPQGVAALNAGNGGAPGVTMVRIGRKEAREIARTDIRAGGIISQTIKSSIRRGGGSAGQSGKLAVA